MLLDVSFKNFGCIWSGPGDLAINMKEDNKIFWKFIKSKTKAKESIPCILGGINTDDKTKSELLNTFFQSVFTVEADSQNAPTTISCEFWYFCIILKI
jgi:hypothetical protein